MTAWWPTKPPHLKTLGSNVTSAGSVGGAALTRTWYGTPAVSPGATWRSVEEVKDDGNVTAPTADVAADTTTVRVDGSPAGKLAAVATWMM